jgi:hypothetical protein
MNTPELIIRKTVSLPENLQREVLDFVDFLLNKYQILTTEDQNTEEEYNCLLTVLLTQRAAEARKNPENILTTEENKRIIFEKYKWHEQV